MDSIYRLFALSQALKFLGVALSHQVQAEMRCMSIHNPAPVEAAPLQLLRASSRRQWNTRRAPME